MGPFTFVPVWVIQDILIIIAGLVTIVFIIKNEKHPVPIVIEFFCFIFFYAAVYENFATLMGWYGYGRSILMIFNVPVTVPIIEYLVVYTTLRLLDHMKIPMWGKPFIAGFSGMLFDFSLDPLAMKQVYRTIERTIGRWTWYPNPGDVTIYGEPVYNFPGWVMLCGYAAALILLGRWWYEKSSYKPAVGYLYPVLAMIISLILIVTPQTRFLLWLEPFFLKGSIGEWIMLAVHFIIPIFILAVFWRGRMKSSFTFKSEFPAFLVLVGFHVSDIVFTLIGGYFDILWLVLLFSGVQTLLVLIIFFRSRIMSRRQNSA